MTDEELLEQDYFILVEKRGLKMINEELEEQDYFRAWELAKDKGFPGDFSKFCEDFDNMIAVARYSEEIE